MFSYGKTTFVCSLFVFYLFVRKIEFFLGVSLTNEVRQRPPPGEVLDSVSWILSDSERVSSWFETRFSGPGACIERCFYPHLYLNGFQKRRVYLQQRLPARLLHAPDRGADQGGEEAAAERGGGDGAGGGGRL